MFFLTVKANVDSRGMIREERNFWINSKEYYDLYKKIEGNTIYKTRYQGVDEDGNPFAIDIFKDDLEGLAYFEVEFRNEELANSYIPPSWITKEVTSDSRYKTAWHGMEYQKTNLMLLSRAQTKIELFFKLLPNF